MKPFLQYEEGYISPLTTSEVNELLDELASKSGYTQASIRSNYPKTQRRPRKTIIRALFRQLSPEDASTLVQIILKDLRPLLYPLTEFHYTTALTRFNAASVKMLSKEHAMDIWDPSGMFLRYYRVCADITEAAAFADSPKSKCRVIEPTIGKPVAVSVFIRTFLHSLELTCFRDTQVRERSGMRACLEHPRRLGTRLGRDQIRWRTSTNSRPSQRKRLFGHHHL
jgi:hypothetical protein